MRGRRGILGRGLVTGASALLAAGAIGACGASTANEDQGREATGSFPASVSASFPARQRLAEPTRLVVRVHNSGTQTMPDVAVTLTNPKDGNGAQALGMLLASPAPGQPILAGRSRPVWIIDQSPGPCGYACGTGADGGAAATAYTNTWALGRLAPGATRTFTWRVTAVQPGRYTVAYRVAAGLSGQASATGSSTAGSLAVVVSGAPRQAYINNAGQPVEESPGS